MQCLMQEEIRKACKQLYTMLIAKKLDRNSFHIPIVKFHQNFEANHDFGLLAETTKFHHLYSKVHLERELADSGKVLYEWC